MLASTMCATALLHVGVAEAGALSPPQKTIFITANLQEGYNDRDLKNMRELPIFVGRVLSRVPHDPDVLLLQEVRRKSASAVAQILSNRTGHRYTVAFGGARDPWTGTPSRINVRDSAILLNKATMTKVGDGGWLEEPKDSSANRPMYKGHAYGFARRNGTAMTFAMTSIHIQESSVTETTKGIANKLAAKRPDINSGRYNVIGGDFNTSRQTSPNHPSPYWSWLTGSPRNYRDSIYAVRGPMSTAVDYIFARAGVYAAGVDSSYNNRTQDPAKFYSDHRFRWAALGPDRVAPSVPNRLQARNVNSGIQLSWAGSTDSGGSGVGRYEVYRVKKTGPPRMIGTSKSNSYNDNDTYFTKRYKYFVRARDKAHNRTAPTGTIQLTRQK
ncbi:MAG: endonuclease/exonuclease/phosphatase family protein [Actinobacteria bacterium]|nr:endonuclease/exonuclease/phosphatase family protein [Actinomycetota bacterium]MDQ3532498.1 endonuclease/exonuclease/phosphatase family protein [Actinomycetota bacterium]